MSGPILSDGPMQAVQQKDTCVQAVILVGGLGTRLRPLINDRSKPMAPIAGKPFLEYLLMQLRNAGITDIVLCIAHHGAQIREYFDAGDRWNVRITYAQEEELRGTAGALRVAFPLITEKEFLVMNGDSFFEIDFPRLVRYHRRKQAVATIALARSNDAERFGSVKADTTGQIVRFAEKERRTPEQLINAGVYVFRREVLESIPSDRPFSLERELFPQLIGKGLYGFPVDAYFVDIGTPDSYAQLSADPAQLIAAVK